jgi:hypothetical protein
MRSVDIYTYMEEGDGGEGSWCCVEEGGSLLLFVLLLWPWWVSVSLVLEFTPPFSLLSLSFSL